MKKACFYTNPYYLNDEVFNEQNPILNQNNLLEPYRRLKIAFAERGYALRTQDIHSSEESEIVLYTDMPKRLPPLSEKSKSFLLLMETWLIRPDNWNKRKHNRFRKVFTYSEKHLAKGAPYVRMYLPEPEPWPNFRNSFDEREKLCCLIAGGKLSMHPNELYSERIRWIRWFESHHPNDFEFYGSGWDRMWMTGPIWIRAINKLPLWRKLFYSNFKSYKGRVADKYEVMENYKFAICLENARDIEGYITEKIFDCFFAGCVPLYRGPQNITEHVPKDCFIDLRDFTSREAVYDRISLMTKAEYEGYQNRIRAYLQSEKFKPFTSSTFVNTIIRETLDT